MHGGAAPGLLFQEALGGGLSLPPEAAWEGGGLTLTDVRQSSLYKGFGPISKAKASLRAK